MAFIHIGSGFQCSRGTEKLFCIRLTGFCQHESEIQVGLEDVRLGSHGFPIRGNRVWSVSQRVVNESQVEPGLKVVGNRGDDLLKQRLSRRIVVFFDCGLGLGELGREGRILFDNLVMTHSLAGVLGEVRAAEADPHKQQRQTDWPTCPHSTTIHFLTTLFPTNQSPTIHFRSIYLPETFRYKTWEVQLSLP